MVANAGDDSVDIDSRVAEDECVVNVYDDVHCFYCSGAVELAVIEG